MDLTHFDQDGNAWMVDVSDIFLVTIFEFFVSHKNNLPFFYKK